MLHCIIFLITGERLTLLVLRSAPGLGNITVDWTVQGPLAHRTFIQTSGTIFFNEVNKMSYVFFVKHLFPDACVFLS